MTPRHLPLGPDLEKPKTNAMPVGEKVVPPQQVQLKFPDKHWLGDLFFWKQSKRSNMQHKKVLPGQTTFAAWCTWPIRDSRSCLFYHFHVSHEVISSFKANNFSAGRRATWWTESSTIPRTTSTVKWQNRHLGQWRNSTEAKRSSHGSGIGGRRRSGNQMNKCRDKCRYNKISPTLDCGSGCQRKWQTKPTPEAARTEAWASSWPKD